MQNHSVSPDIAAITLSGLCLIHCLALPLLAGGLPILGILSESEWVHRVFVLLAVPTSFIAFARAPFGQKNMRLPFCLAIAGLLLLIGGAFVEAWHDVEKPLTLSGAVLLAFAHLWRWRAHIQTHN